MKKYLAVLREKMQPFLESVWFARVSWVAAIIAPLPLATQLFKAATAPSVEGISLEAYVMLSVFHAIMACRGIKTLDGRIFTTLTMTSIIATGIVITALSRGGKFF